MDGSKTSEVFAKWLKQQHEYQVRWASVIAARTALRVIPFAVGDDIVRDRAGSLTLGAFRCCSTSWAAINYPAFGMKAANAEAFKSRDFQGAANNAGEPLYSAAYVISRANYAAFTDKFDSVYHAVDAVDRSTDADYAAFADALAHTAFRATLDADCSWLASEGERHKAARRITARKLWPIDEPTGWRNQWELAKAKLLGLDTQGTYQFWIDWYERRIRGERAAFDIPGDKGRVEDKKILRHLAEATDEDFWGKGHEYVNATLKGWLDEARARVAPPIPEIDPDIGVPSQEPGAIAYGVNNDGMLDRLPPSDQYHLRDLPNQRRAYADLRETALELREEGQRLGPRLQPRIERAVASLPEKFEDAEAWPVWRDFNALRRLFRAHQIAFANPEPDAAKLEPVIAETLGGLLDIYNNFAFADDGLRAKDENRISPQERASAEAEAVAASPVIEAIRYASSIATDLAREDIITDAENIELPVGDPYGAQVLDQANRTRRNWLAGAFEGARRAMANPKIVGKAIAIGVVGGAAGVVGKVAMTGMVGLEYGPLLQFIATNAAILQNYAAVAFSSYPQLNDLIERISVMWKTRKSSSS